MKEIRADAKSIRALLGGAKYDIEYYQREYRWERKHVTELIDDLAEVFLDHYEQGDERTAVEDYGHYFLGSIIISEGDGQKHIIDGQQRLTTLTIVLIYIYRRLPDENHKAQLADLIFSQRFGTRSFNLDVPQRRACMEALFSGEVFEEDDQPESVTNILRRFRDIEEHFPEECNGAALPFFADWLIENVDMVQITSYSDADAYTIFETMNDRGLSLTPTDMLKGYLLSKITAVGKRNEASRAWRKQVEKLQDLGKDQEASAIKAWLRSQHALTIRERKRGAKPRDFDKIGTEFHRWVRKHEAMLGLSVSETFARFIQGDFAFYAHWYYRIRQAARTLTNGLEAIHFNARNNFTLQYPALLAPLSRTDPEEEILRKLRIVSTYLDILIARRVWNWKSTSYSAMQYNIFQLVVLKIRGKSAGEVATILAERLSADEYTFASNDRFSLTGRNGRKIHRLLARMTAYVETCSTRPSRYHEYIQRRGGDGYEVEHIWANHPERHTDEFSHPADFGAYRNRIGGLLILPKRFNASYGDKPYAEKREHYYGRNLLAASLDEKAYQHDPGFLRFLEESGLPFKPHVEFKKADLDSRQRLYQRLAEQIWNPENLLREAAS